MKKIVKRKNNNNKLTGIINLFVWLIYIILTGFLIYNIINLANIENLIRIIIIVILIISSILLTVFQKKKRTLCKVIMIILSIIFIFLNYTFYRVYSSLNNITTKVDTKGICLVTTLKDIEDITEIKKESIAILGQKMDEDFYEMGEDILEKNKLNNSLIEYEDYFQIINALINKEINYAFLPENYNDIYRANQEDNGDKSLDFKVIHKEQKEIKNNENTEPLKTIDEPFSVLLMGTDVILDSYNADTLLLLTINPKTLEVTMLSIPRDTYTTIACSGGKHKINASGWYGDKCVVKTVEKYLNIDIDYYAKINFLGIVDLVDNLGGIEVEVPYAFCEQNSRREFGNQMIYVEEGMQTLNGEQALALTRNRHYWKDICPKKYTSDGNRSDITRGENQQLVIKALLNKIMSIRNINQFYAVLDTIGNNMSTNMSRDTILSFYNIGKSIIKRLNTNSIDEIINVNQLSFEYYFANVYISGLELSTIVNYKESVDYVTKEMKKNLELIKKDVIKNFSFDINEPYEPNKIKFNKLTSNLKLLPNFIGKPLSNAIQYCASNGIKYESSTNDLDSLITNQSIHANTDVSTIGNKTIKFETEINKIPVIDITSKENEEENITNESNNQDEKEPETDSNINNNPNDKNEPENGNENNEIENDKPQQTLPEEEGEKNEESIQES